MTLGAAGPRLCEIDAVRRSGIRSRDTLFTSCDGGSYRGERRCRLVTSRRARVGVLLVAAAAAGASQNARSLEDCAPSTTAGSTTRVGALTRPRIAPWRVPNYAPFFAPPSSQVIWVMEHRYLLAFVARERGQRLPAQHDSRTSEPLPDQRAGNFRSRGPEGWLRRRPTARAGGRPPWEEGGTETEPSQGNHAARRTDGRFAARNAGQ
jgi:hypothetical protein